MPIYRVRPKFTHGAFNQYKAGDTVELTEQEAAGFLDKLELVGDSPTLVVTGVTGATAGTAGGEQPIDTGSATNTPSATDGTPPSGDDTPPEPFDVAGATVDEVLASVKEGQVTASDALIAEQQGKKRSSLIEALTKLMEPEAGV